MIRGRKPDSDNTLYFLGFEYLNKHYNEIELYRKISELVSDEIFKTAAEKNSFLIKETDNRCYLIDYVSGNKLFSLKADISENAVVLEPVFSSIEKGIFTSDIIYKSL